MSTEDNKVKFNNVEYEIKPLTVKEFLELVYLVTPYTKHIRDLKEMYYSDSTDVVFYYDLTVKFINDLPYDDLFKALGIIYKLEYDILLEIPITELIDGLLVAIRVNKLLEVIMMGKLLGVIDG